MENQNFTAASVKVKFGKRRYMHITIGGIYEHVDGYEVRVMGFIMKPSGEHGFTVRSLVVDRWPHSVTKFEIKADQINPTQKNKQISIMSDGASRVGKTTDGCEIYVTNDEYPMAINENLFKGGVMPYTTRSVH
ncbi:MULTISPECIES: hypothetical protein [Acidithiobacillus]|uniref:Uncharacterized protein n=2 Tax=Acidithiobacillus TaxID=119977 RepID=A0A179BNE6_ACIFR|nr:MULTISPECIES: hypothetical protein [Acidithiobacillus]MEB8488114.1 hypothetical protein [Acidithiobacillus ferriphilus]MEB8488700.1 hypothetical protein [Acidithiobacillus ferriphilus]MEB8492144.1 hypothetical protein [Acidithiobacillus ferriphilus]MEB8513448.1 hypothetical protein [Acidithiobacillus ferriphilus]MEB8520343.1 hypothetical protein [Acidithiobacillus ferriphilus]